MSTLNSNKDTEKLHTVPDRVAYLLEKPPFSPTQLAGLIGVSRNAIYRWKNKEVENIDSKHIEALARVLHINYNWIRFGEGPLSQDVSLSKIESNITATDKSHEDQDRILLSAELKANNLVRDLQSLVDDLRKLHSLRHD